ncbi:MAG: hypothetical protein J6U10_01750 [Lachnospiraceae bacterium]|nr:hypothetical protein [Lachnospiraceae bacterium]MBP5185007.1 hypothetical protein [Lachnospiraceae bacterium]
MATINVYEQYFEAKCTANGVKRRGAKVMLISDSCDGCIKYEAAVSFFPHKTDDDFAVSYDAYYTKELYNAKGRRSKKREKELLEGLKNVIDGLAAETSGKIYWEKPLTEERRG